MVRPDVLYVPRRTFRTLLEMQPGGPPASIVAAPARANASLQRARARYRQGEAQGTPGLTLSLVG